MVLVFSSGGENWTASDRVEQLDEKRGDWFVALVIYRAQMAHFPLRRALVAVGVALGEAVVVGAGGAAVPVAVARSSVASAD